MKILQRRVKRSAPAVSVLSARMVQYRNMAWSRWQLLSARDRMALTVLTLFLLLFVGGYGGYSLHQAAKQSKENYQAKVADYFWLRAQAGNIDSGASNGVDQNETATPPASRISMALNSAGINDAQVVAMGDTVQLSFSHPSQAVVSTTLAQLEQQGWQLTQLSILQDTITQQLQVQATFST